MMQTSVNPSKLHRPRAGAHVVLRPHLEASLATTQGLALVIAPAGYGKTTLVSVWLEHGVLPSAWLSLDEQDNDPVVFVTYLVTAVRALFPDACEETLALLRGMIVPPDAMVSRTLLHDLALLEQEFVLVLDDYHVIHERAIHAIVTEITRHPPPALRLVFLARKDPPLPLASLRARGDVVELREADLRFSLEEVTSFMRDEMQLKIDDQGASVLMRGTEGWVAGLRLTALYIRHTGDLGRLAAYPQSYNRYVIDYLVAEVLEQVPSAIKDFLLRTSILEYLCEPLCAAVAGITGPEGDSQTCLEWLEQNNLFLLPTDDEHFWFRYHHLFRRILIEQLERQQGSTDIRALHKRASDWFAQHGYAEESLRHAQASGDTAAAVHVFALHRRVLTNGEEWHRLERWVKSFPRAVIEQEPELLLSEAWLMINRQQLASLPAVLDRVEALLAERKLDPETTERLSGEVALRRATQFYYAGGMAASRQSALLALAKLPAEWYMLRAQARLFVSVGLLAAGELRQAYATVYDADEADHGKAFQMRLLVNACFTHNIAGDLPGLIQAATKILEGNDLSSFQVETGTWARYHLAVAHYYRNDLAAAERELTLLMRKPYQAHVQCFLNGAAALALLNQAQDQPEKAQELVDSMVALVLDIQGTIGLPVAKAFQAELALRQGRYQEAIAWMENFDVPIARPRPFFYRAPSTLVRILLAQNTAASRSRAGQVLADLRDYYTSIHYTVVLVEVLGLQALLEQAEGRVEAALATLQRAIDLAEPGGIVRMFVDEGATMQELLATLVRGQAAGPHAARILDAFPAALPSAAAAHQANAALLSPLTPRELEVLALLEKRYTDREIAETLVISPDTVHSHVQHIGDKLAARGRHAIVTTAKEQGILA